MKCCYSNERKICCQRTCIFEGGQLLDSHEQSPRAYLPSQVFPSVLLLLSSSSFTSKSSVIFIISSSDAWFDFLLLPCHSPAFFFFTIIFSLDTNFVLYFLNVLLVFFLLLRLFVFESFGRRVREIRELCVDVLLWYLSSSYDLFNSLLIKRRLTERKMCLQTSIKGCSHKHKIHSCIIFYDKTLTWFANNWCRESGECKSRESRVDENFYHHFVKREWEKQQQFITENGRQVNNGLKYISHFFIHMIRCILLCSWQKCLLWNNNKNRGFSCHHHHLQSRMNWDPTLKRIKI